MTTWTRLATCSKNRDVKCQKISLSIWNIHYQRACVKKMATNKQFQVFRCTFLSSIGAYNLLVQLQTQTLSKTKAKFLLFVSSISGYLQYRSSPPPPGRKRSVFSCERPEEKTVHLCMLSGVFLHPRLLCCWRPRAMPHSNLFARGLIPAVLPFRFSRASSWALAL